MAALDLAGKDDPRLLGNYLPPVDMAECPVFVALGPQVGDGDKGAYSSWPARPVSEVWSRPILTRPATFGGKPDARLSVTARKE
jgi:hypothetical protein